MTDGQVTVGLLYYDRVSAPVTVFRIQYHFQIPNSEDFTSNDSNTQNLKIFNAAKCSLEYTLITKAIRNQKPPKIISVMAAFQSSSSP